MSHWEECPSWRDGSGTGKVEGSNIHRTMDLAGCYRAALTPYRGNEKLRVVEKQLKCKCVDQRASGNLEKSLSPRADGKVQLRRKCRFW